MNFSEIEALKKLTGANDSDEDDRHVYGSSLTPASLHFKSGDDADKEIAKPNAKIEFKTNTRAVEGGATEEALL